MTTVLVSLVLASAPIPVSVDPTGSGGGLDPTVVAAGIAAVVSLVTAALTFIAGWKARAQQAEQARKQLAAQAEQASKQLLEQARQSDRQLQAQFQQLEAAALQFRETQHLESTRLLTERFREAAAQIGSDAPAVRLAGVYAMAALADEWTEQRRRQCVDVLCGYMRLPPREQQGEDQVRLTVVGVIRERLQEGAAVNWSEMDFDLSGAVFPDGFSLSGARFHRSTTFARAKFIGTASFADVDFGGDAWFDGVDFGGTASFAEVQFGGYAWFTKAAFRGTAWFAGTTFVGTASFDKVDFGDAAWFGGAAFKGSANFGESAFCGPATFQGATFRGHAAFGRATFMDTAVFDGATFSATAWFSEVKVRNGARFTRTTFSNDVEFGGAEIHRPVDLTAADCGPTHVRLPDHAATDGPVVISVNAVPPHPGQPGKDMTEREAEPDAS